MTGEFYDALADLRREYHGGGLRREGLDPDPVEQFRKWFEEARKADLLEPNAMVLATAGSDGRVTARTVLLKAFDKSGFVFFTNYESEKATQIAENPRVALLFSWLPLERQVEITGRAEKIGLKESLAYFVKRPIGNQIGAWVSQQSRVISSRKVLEAKFEDLMRKFAGGKVPLPDFWGGYRVIPETVEFWQGAPSRLHDRFLYTQTSAGSGWATERLAP